MHSPVQTETTSRNTPPRTSETQLQGKPLVFARMVWSVLVVLTLGLFAASFPVYVAQLQDICTGTACSYTQLSPETVRTLQHLGLSTTIYATTIAVFAIALTLIWWIVSGIIVWHKSNDWMALLVALMLVTLGADQVMSMVGEGHSVWQIPARFLDFLSAVLPFLFFSTSVIFPC